LSAAAFDADAVPRFRRGVRLREDRARGRWVVMAPERAFVPDEVALAVLQLLDGERTVAAIADALAARFDAPRAVIEADVLEMLRDLSARGVVSAG